MTKTPDRPSQEQRPRTGAELVEYWRREGLIGYRTEIADSAAYARHIRRRFERRIPSQDSEATSQ